MGLLIDSSVLISTERGRLHLPELLAEQGELSPAIAAITASELLHGVYRADLIIAATAISLDLSVLTRDLRSFPRIPGLNVIAC